MDDAVVNSHWQKAKGSCKTLIPIIGISQTRSWGCNCRRIMTSTLLGPAVPLVPLELARDVGKDSRVITGGAIESQ